MSGRPKISVCIPVYNQERYLRAAIDSVLAQTLGDFELVVYDDASTDGTGGVIAAVDDPRVRAFRQPRTVGISANRNSCLAVARGEYIAWLDADDVHYPDFLEAQSAVLDAEPRVGLAHAAYEVIDGEDRRLPDWSRPFAEDTVEPGTEAFAELVLANYVGSPTVLVRRACYERLGGYTPELTRSGEDWELWMRISLHYDLAYTARPLAQYRYHAGSSSAATVASGERLRLDVLAVERVLREQRRAIPDAGRLRRRAHAALAFKFLLRSGDAFTRGRRSIAFAAALRALRLAPGLAAGGDAWRLLASVVRGDEYENYRASKSLLAWLFRELEETRFGAGVRKLAVVDPQWQRTVEEAAGTVRRHVPRGERIAAVDKEDPTLLHLSGRTGWHFPARDLLPDGYPADSELAVHHLEQLRTRGASYIVFPNAAFWWLEHYTGLREHLDSRYERVHADESCVLYRLATNGGAS